MAIAQAGLFTGVSIALQAVFRAITKGATAVEKVASAGDHLAGYLDDTAATFAEQAKAERTQKSMIFEHNLRIQQKEIEATVGRIALPDSSTNTEVTS